jgi:hypothetical protein
VIFAPAKTRCTLQPISLCALVSDRFYCWRVIGSATPDPYWAIAGIRTLGRLGRRCLNLQPPDRPDALEKAIYSQAAPWFPSCSIAVVRPLPDSGSRLNLARQARSLPPTAKLNGHRSEQRDRLTR